jgi:hypothetical protein
MMNSITTNSALDPKPFMSNPVMKGRELPIQPPRTYLDVFLGVTFNFNEVVRLIASGYIPDMNNPINIEHRNSITLYRCNVLNRLHSAIEMNIPVVNTDIC